MTDIKKNSQAKLLEMKLQMCEVKNTLDWVYDRLDISEEKSRKLENVVMIFLERKHIFFFKKGKKCQGTVRQLQMA